MRGKLGSVRKRAILAAVLPARLLRILAYRALLGFRISFGARVGFLAVIDAGEVRIARGATLSRATRFTGLGSLEIGESARIGPRTRIAGAGEVRIGARADIGGLNVFQVPSWANDPGSLRIEEDVVVTSEHFFDLTESVTIQKRSIVGGIRSSFWTHGAGERGGHGPIVIGEGSYLASDVKMAPGVCLPKRTLVGLGSVVIKAPPGPGTFIAGAPARVVRDSW